MASVEHVQPPYEWGDTAQQSICVPVIISDPEYAEYCRRHDFIVVARLARSGVFDFLPDVARGTPYDLALQQIYYEERNEDLESGSFRSAAHALVNTTFDTGPLAKYVQPYLS